MTDILKGLLSDTSDISDFEQPNVPMFVLTNDETINGASKLLDSITMDEVAKRIGTNFYILPSSIHETILVTATDCSISELEKMVMEVNETEVAAEEILSDHGIKFFVSESKYYEIAHEAFNSLTGVRSMNNKLEAYLDEELFYNPDVKEITIE